jgi:hypothetical protein
MLYKKRIREAPPGRSPRLTAYTWWEKKPSLNIQPKEQFLISN